MALIPTEFEHPHDRKVVETRPTVLSDQHIVLDALSISLRVRTILCFTYRTNTAVENTQPMKVHKATAHLCKLSQV